MSSMTHRNHQKGEHGTTASYIVGFILSLIFSIIPYYLVVNKIVTGNSLLATILGFAVLQMFIQIFFFLHLGRGPKPLYNVVFFFATVGIILVTVLGSIFIMNNLYRNMHPSEIAKHIAEDEGIYQVSGEKTGACHGTKENHKVVIKNGIVTPSQIDAQKCDTLTFVNEDEQDREMAFGAHPNHDSYSGYQEIALKSRPKSITLNETGEYMFHDHLDPTVYGYFKVIE